MIASPVVVAGGALATYVFGAIPFALIIGKLFYGVDIREHGSGNVGATNVVRVLGRKPGIACFVLDFLKGCLPVSLAVAAHLPWWVPLLYGVLAIVGHSRSVFLGFKGGKSVATGAGVIVALAPWVGLAVLGVWAAVFFAGRIVSLASIVAAGSLPLWMLLFKQPLSTVLFGVVTALYVIVRHRSNIERLLKGQEPRMGARKS
ncbi:glycerol-3-phosphate 1-O-acyltransferase PlsY [bacterium]|nr:glycerol-3-phosphate 1-O-acyltransferase PlsY [bacterium]